MALKQKKTSPVTVFGASPLPREHIEVWMTEKAYIHCFQGIQYQPHVELS